MCGCHGPRPSSSRSRGAKVSEIPEYPSGIPASQVRREDLVELVGGIAPYSDYTFGSMRYWDTQNRIRVSQLAGNLVVRFYDYLEGGEFYGLAGCGDVVKTAKNDVGKKLTAAVSQAVAAALAN